MLSATHWSLVSRWSFDGTVKGTPAAKVETISDASDAFTAAMVTRYVSPAFAPGISPHRVTGPA
jgi:hypothetical protein